MHSWHCCPSLSETVPGWQRSQLVLSALLSLPCAQLVHSRAATPEIVPVAHVSQVSEVVLCHVPASHRVHTGIGVHFAPSELHVVVTDPA